MKSKTDTINYSKMNFRLQKKIKNIKIKIIKK